jgi:Putative MetA-pathway of phenol degradation
MKAQSMCVALVRRVFVLTTATVVLSHVLISSVCFAQDLAPRAYVITPIHSNAIILTYSFYDGGILFDGTLPISDASANISASIFTVYHSLSFFGRSSNFTASLPYGVGDFQGKFIGSETKLYRSGLLDSVFRFSVNIKGGPAMTPQEFGKWRQKTILGVSLKVLAPTGQYDPTKLINNGANRWAFKPEFGYSERWGHWVLDAYGGMWFFTPNFEYYSHNKTYPGTNTQSQGPIASFEGHLSYDFKPRLWLSLDGNYWYGGRTSFNGVEIPKTLQANSRIGGTVSIPLTKQQTLKFSYSSGTVIRFGGNYQNVNVAWQYSWLGRPN